MYCYCYRCQKKKANLFGLSWNSPYFCLHCAANSKTLSRSTLQHKWLSVGERKKAYLKRLLFSLPFLPLKKSEVLPQQVLSADGVLICSRFLHLNGYVNLNGFSKERFSILIYRKDFCIYYPWLIIMLVFPVCITACEIFLFVKLWNCITKVARRLVG